MRFVLLLGFLAISAGCGVGLGDSVSSRPHGGPAARSALAKPGYDWAIREGEGFHLHYPRGSVAEERINRFFEEAAEAVRYDVSIFGAPRSPGPIELLLVDSREGAVDLAGTPFMGRAFPGELSAMFVAGTAANPAFVHEIAHVLTLDRWGVHRAGSWMAEGVATWAAGDCLDEPLDSIAAGYLQRGELPRLVDLERSFWELDELAAYFAAGSLIGFVEARAGLHAVEKLWSEDTWPADAAQVESEWRAHLTNAQVVKLDPDRLRKYGCEGPA